MAQRIARLTMCPQESALPLGSLSQTTSEVDGDVCVSETDTVRTAEVGKQFAGASVDPCASEDETEEGVSVAPSDWEADSECTGDSASVCPSQSSNQVSRCSQRPEEQARSPMRSSRGGSAPVSVVKPWMSSSRSTPTATVSEKPSQAMEGLSKDGSPRYAGVVTWSRGSMAWLRCAALPKQFDWQVFLHKKQCKHGSMPRKGDRVIFTLVVGDDGRPQAHQAEPEVKPSEVGKPQQPLEVQTICARDWFAARMQK